MPIELSEAIALHRAGNLDRASQIYESAIADDPAFDLAYHLLGLLSIHRGDLARAVGLFERAIALRPEVSQYHGGIAEAFWALGQWDQAVESGREALRLNPANWQVRCNLGTTLVQRGDVDEAITLFREAIRLHPNFSQSYNNLGQALQLKGESAAALENFRVALRLDPTSAEIHANLGKILLDRSETEEALKHCQEAIRLRPDWADAHYKLGNVYQVLGRVEEAEACFRRSIQHGPNVAAGHACLGAALEHLGDQEQALASYREALRLDPRNAWVLAKLAIRFKDRLPETEKLAIESLLASPALVSDHRIPLLYGYAHVFDARGDFDRAARLTIEANARQQAEFEERGLGYDAPARSNDVEQIIKAFTPDFFERVKPWGMPTERPVFIVGVPRSGTSLVEQILASHSRVFGAGERRLAQDSFRAFVEGSGPVQSLRECLDRLDKPALERLARSHLDGLEALDRSKDRIIDKMPENTLFLGLMAALFPNARIIYCRRDPRDTALSCWMTHFGHLRWSCDPGYIAAKIAETSQLMEHWSQVLPIPIFNVDYEDLVENLESRSRSLVEACGLEWEPACLDFHQTRRHVKTASVLQVRQPIYRASVGRWKNYERALAFLFEKLDPTVPPDETRKLGL